MGDELHMGKIQELPDSLDPEAALEERAAALKKVRPAVSPEGRLNLVRQIAGDAWNYKVASLVHLLLLREYQIKGVPTLIFLDGEGKEYRNLCVLDYMPPEQLLLRLKALKDK